MRSGVVHMRCVFLSLPAIALVWVVGLRTSAPADAADDYDLAIRYVGENPADAEPVFANNIQGVAQDGAHWFITQTEDLWRFPIGMDTSRIHVWGDWPFSGSGTVIDPYPTVTQAINLAWDG